MINIESHPDYTLYRRIQQTNANCLAIVERWRADEFTIDVPEYRIDWTPAKAAEFFGALSRMLKEYNQVLWEGFTYCQLCKGKCCTDGVIEAAEAYDFLALALLDEKMPESPRMINSTEKTCIYLDGPRCTWPQKWRLYKCWSYYCLGPASVWQNMQDGKDLNQRYEELHRALILSVEAHLPSELRKYEKCRNFSFANTVSSPTAFAQILHSAINDVLVFPLSKIYPELLAQLKPEELEAMDQKVL